MDAQEARHLSIAGVVQGVGFRPFVYTLATRLGLAGWVLNNSAGVEIELEGEPDALERFVETLTQQPPPLARLESVRVWPIAPQGFVGFQIRHSERLEGCFQLISPDVAICPACRRELFDPADRRYRYPFINCTHCGPRFTIISDIPYDRPNTTMRVFPLCPACQGEYDDPTDRRFHAQPNACPICGPHIWLTDAAGRPLAGDAATADNAGVLALAGRLLRAGQVLAIRGLGGFHLACDATQADVVERLRQRKRRPAKPFAVMLADLETVRRECDCTPAEEAMLECSQAPIVILARQPNSRMAEAVAPAQNTLGVMLPYTPLHHLLLAEAGRPLVMTSGNMSEEPIAADNNEALRRLGGLADAFLLHNREIFSRYDDSVWQIGTVPQPQRRARGYAPLPVRLPFSAPPLLAVGPELKNTFCLARQEYAFISQHIGDMENLETLEHFEATLALYRRLFRLEPETVACDMHPDYLSTRFAQGLLERGDVRRLIAVQHHKAHIASCLVDNGWTLDDGPVIGVALDGTGFGEDGAIWGGEWLMGDVRGLRRAAHLEYLPLPGGDAAIRRPWRVAAAYLLALGETDLPAGLTTPAELALLEGQLARRLNVPLTSSMGRLFDATSALLGVCREASYEAQAAIELEALAAPADGRTYPFGMREEADGLVVRLGPLLCALLEERRAGVAVPLIAGRFHASVAEMLVEVCRQLRRETDLGVVALSGGTFQNRMLLGLAVPALEAAGFRVLLHRQVPSNDGGLSLGQAALAACQIGMLQSDEERRPANA